MWPRRIQAAVGCTSAPRAVLDHGLDDFSARPLLIRSALKYSRKSWRDPTPSMALAKKPGSRFQRCVDFARALSE
jgi:hypothetical protein